MKKIGFLRKQRQVAIVQPLAIHQEGFCSFSKSFKFKEYINQTITS